MLANGRLRGAWDLAAFANEMLDEKKTSRDQLSSALREYVHELTPSEFCLRLCSELAEACEAAENVGEGAFWQLQREVLAGQISLAEERRRQRDDFWADK